MSVRGRKRRRLEGRRYLYHATSLHALPGIAEHGLLRSKPRWNPKRGKHVYLTIDHDTALNMAAYAAKKPLVMLRIWLDDIDPSQLTTDKADQAGDVSMKYGDNIPPEVIEVLTLQEYGDENYSGVSFVEPAVPVRQYVAENAHLFVK